MADAAGLVTCFRAGVTAECPPADVRVAAERAPADGRDRNEYMDNVFAVACCELSAEDVVMGTSLNFVFSGFAGCGV